MVIRVLDLDSGSGKVRHASWVFIRCKKECSPGRMLAAEFALYIMEAIKW